MQVISNLGNAIAIISVFLLMLVEESTQETKELSLDDHKLCSEITKRKVKFDSLLVTQGRASQHTLPWVTPNICKFEIQSIYRKGGVVAVIQNLNLRRNFTTGDCIDYVQFGSKRGSSSQRHCGTIDARLNMNYDKDNAPASMLPAYFPISYSNSFIDVDGELAVIIYIAKQALEFHEKTEFKIVFTSFQNCSNFDYTKYVFLKECQQHHTMRICINKNLFGDGYINCPHAGCVDEGGCSLPVKPEGKMSVGNRVIIGSISTLGLLFAIFIVIIWAFKKHKLFCWAEQFAYPSPTPESNRNSRVIEMNEQTGARLATETIAENVTPSAPIADEDKDLPPSYDSLFPEAANPRSEWNDSAKIVFQTQSNSQNT